MVWMSFFESVPCLNRLKNNGGEYPSIGLLRKNNFSSLSSLMIFPSVWLNLCLVVIQCMFVFQCNCPLWTHFNDRCFLDNSQVYFKSIHNSLTSSGQFSVVFRCQMY